MTMTVGGEGQAAQVLRPALRGALHRSSVPVAVCLTVVLAARASTPGTRAAAVVYGVCVVAMLTVSGVYHLPSLFHRDRRVLRRLDHSTIVVAIAGTYTGVIAIGMDGGTRVSLLALVWAMAALGIVARMLWFDAQVLAGAVYFGLGWFGAVHPTAFLDALDSTELAFLVTGGLLYTVGAVLFALKRPNPWPATFGYHEVWHVFVVAAALCHWTSVYLLAA
jgi:hemolysin III